MRARPHAPALVPFGTGRTPAHAQPGVLLLPGIVPRFADPHLATKIAHFLACFRLAQHRHDLLFRMTPSAASSLLLSRTVLPKIPLLPLGAVFRFWVSSTGFSI